jgi:uncharacterized membrane protein
MIMRDLTMDCLTLVRLTAAMSTYPTHLTATTPAVALTKGKTMTSAIHWAILATGLGCALVAGVTFAFSAFIMPALDRLAPAQSIAAMNSINELAVTPAFMLAFVGTALACLALAAWALFAGEGRATVWIVAGAALYLVGMLGVTGAANVPLNDALAAVAPHASDAAARWNSYLGDWTVWNVVRTVAGLAASGMFAIALRIG